MLRFALWVRVLWGSGSWSRPWRSWGIDAGAHQEKQIDKKDGDEDEAADEDVWSEAHHGFVARKVRRRDVVGFVIAFVHAHKLTSPMRERAARHEIF
jgi:hypothetical protein